MTADYTSQEKVREGLTAALDRKASAVLVFNLTDLTSMADYFVLSTASSDRLPSQSTGPGRVRGRRSAAGRTRRRP